MTDAPSTEAVKPLQTLRRNEWLFGLILLVATLVAYYPAWHGKPLWDDDAHMTSLQLSTWPGLVRIWFQPGATQQYYPLVHSVFWVEQKIFGDSTPGYHLVNIVLHVFCAMLLFKILRMLEVPGAWLAAAIFALHPMQVESVAWISELKNTLSGTFYLGAALVYLRFDQSRARRLYYLALGLFFLGLLCKTVIATLPAALLVVIWWKRGALSWKEDAKPLVPFFALGIVMGLFTAHVEKNLIIGGESASFPVHAGATVSHRGQGILVLHREAAVAWEIDLHLPAVGCERECLVAVSIPHGGAGAAGCALDAAQVDPDAAGGGAFLWRDFVSGAGVCECLSVHLFVCGGPLSIPCGNRAHHAGIGGRGDMGGTAAGLAETGRASAGGGGITPAGRAHAAAVRNVCRRTDALHDHDQAKPGMLDGLQ